MKQGMSRQIATVRSALRRRCRWLRARVAELAASGRAALKAAVRLLDCRLARPIERVLIRLKKQSSASQRRAFLIAGFCVAALLLAANVLVILESKGLLRPRVSNGLQLAYIQASEAEKALIARAEAAGTDPDTDSAVVAARCDLVFAQLALGQTTQAARLCAVLSAATAKNPNVHYAYGATLQAQNKLSAASTEYAQALKLLAPGETELRRQILSADGQVLRSRGKKTAALDALTSAAVLKPQSATLFTEAGDLAFELGRVREAAGDYYRARLYRPDDTDLQEKITRLEREYPAETADAQRAFEAENDEGER
jgi:tetratricopeptide (TPR) repeat protein